MPRSVAVHPLAIVGIADHFTRVKQGGSPQAPTQPAVGLLMGTRRGLQSNILDAADLSYTDNGTETVIAESQIETKRALTRAVYPDYEVLGWYTIAEGLEALHARIHECLAAYVDDPLFLVMKPLGLGDTAGQDGEGMDGSDAPDGTEALPLTVYEMGVATEEFGFVSLAFQLETAVRLSSGQ